ncbi:helicase C-terminal domain-containing protein [Thalassobaculum sp.]|uniref:helicase C-terminal domain-containing protein n=1 Tax=Thalassobaculum sp. TaxID=2022740 RepID=UPI0032ED5598
MRSSIASVLAGLPALHATPVGAAWRHGDGKVERVASGRAAVWAHDAPPVVCHARSVARRLGVDSIEAMDVLELFAFVRPATFCLPTPRGLAEAVGLPPPGCLEAAPDTLLQVADALLAELPEREALGQRDRWARPIARAMHDGGWPWGRLVLSVLGEPDPGPPAPIRPSGLEVWRDLAEWSEHAPPPPAGHEPVSEDEARRRLSEILGTGSEARPSQADYAAAVAAAFRPREREDEPTVVLAEAGTGVGKTIGYLAPASVWAEKNEGAVWISTYTRNLQHQIDGELDRLYPDPVAKALKVVVRKGRENYLCLLNLEEASRTLPMQPQHATALGLMARWARATRDGDLQGGDFPAWLSDLLGRGRTLGLADRRGECVYAACPHYHKCFIERSVRRARRARVVVANHALVMIQAAMGGVDDGNVPARYVFDEGHHVFDAADGAFSANLSALETVELRRWLLGGEGRRAGRTRGLRRRVEELVFDRPAALEMVDAIEEAARALPGDGWVNRLADEQPKGAAEAFLMVVRRQIYARVSDPKSPYGLECEAKPPVDGLIEVADALDRALKRLVGPMLALRGELLAKLDAEAEDLDTGTRLRIEAVARSLTRRGEAMVEGWRAMLRSLSDATPVEYVDWMAIDRVEGRDLDVGLHRHWIDPTVPFAATVGKAAHGLVVTSATLRDGSGDEVADWAAAENRTGAAHLPLPAIRSAVASPFDYPAHTRVFIVGDVRKDDLDQVAAAYRSLFLASGGGALGLFTAITRLRAVHQRIAGALDAAGLPLYAQHVDGMNLTTLVDIFRAEEEACLLGTDAVRDGVDVPGRSLRLIVFDRVPWPRPDILYRARRAAFGGNVYTDMLTRLRLKQAFGRLVRRADDQGVFVLLDPMMPSRLLGAFPEGVVVKRCGLAEAVDETRAFLRTSGDG